MLTEEKMQDFELKTKIFFGENSLDHLLQKKSKNAMIVADPFTVQSGIIKHVTDRLDKQSFIARSARAWLRNRLYKGG